MIGGGMSHRGMFRRRQGAVSGFLTIEFDDIVNAPVVDPSSVSDWNTFFLLPNLGNPFTSVVVVGNSVKLIGGSSIRIQTSLFSSNINIISFIDTDCVDELLDSAFSNSSIETAIFPTTTRFGASSFAGTSTLSVLEAPELQSLGQTSLENVTALTELDFPNLTHLGSAALRCGSPDTNLVTLNIPNLSSTSGSENLRNRRGLIGTLNINSLVTIPPNFMSGCSGIEKVNAASCTSIGNTAFSGCTSLTEVYAPNLTSIGNTVFTNCGSLNVIDYPLLTTTGTQTFRTVSVAPCQSINLPSLVSIPVNRQFEGLRNLTTIHLDSCTAIGTGTGNDLCFNGLTGKTIDFYLPVGTRTDGDVTYVTTNNTVTFFP